MSAIYFTILTAQQHFLTSFVVCRVSFLVLALSLSPSLCISLRFSVYECLCKSLQRFVIGLLFVRLINNKLSIIKRSFSLLYSLLSVLVFRSLLLSSRQSRRVLRVHVRTRVCVCVMYTVFMPFTE